MGTRGMEWLFRAGLFLLPLVSGMGTLISIGGLAPIRPFVLVLVVIALLLPFRAPSKESMWVVALALVWAGWGFLRPPVPDGLTELVSVGLGLATLWALIVRPVAVRDLRALAFGWVFAWTVSVVPGLYEIATGRHLPNYLEGSPDWVRQASVDIASFFVNPNLFAYFVVVGMVMLVVATVLAESRLVRGLLLAGAMTTPVFAHFSGSRITLAVSLLVLIWIVWNWWPRLRRALVVALVPAVAVGAVGVLYSQPLQQFLESESRGSATGRLGLYKDGVWMIDQTLGLGVGAGRFEPTLANGAAPFDTGGAINPHSGVFEIASQYGILVAGLVFGLVAAVAVVGWQGFRPSFGDHRARVLRQSVFVLAIMLPIESFANSTFLDSPIAWVHVATLGMMYAATKDTPGHGVAITGWRSAARLERRRRVRRQFAGASTGAPLS